MNIDLITTYLGLLFKNPLIASASPLPRTAGSRMGALL